LGVILSEAKNLASSFVLIEERFFASLRMTPKGLFPQTVEPRLTKTMYEMASSCHTGAEARLRQAGLSC